MSPATNNNSMEKPLYKIVQCSLCDKEMTITHLARHMKEIHNTKRVKCYICPKSFKRKEKAINHLRNIHDIKMEDIDRQLLKEVEAPLMKNNNIKPRSYKRKMVKLRDGENFEGVLNSNQIHSEYIKDKIMQDDTHDRRKYLNLTEDEAAILRRNVPKRGRKPKALIDAIEAAQNVATTKSEILLLEQQIQDADSKDDDSSKRKSARLRQKVQKKYQELEEDEGLVYYDEEDDEEDEEERDEDDDEEEDDDDEDEQDQDEQDDAADQDFRTRVKVEIEPSAPRKRSRRGRKPLARSKSSSRENTVGTTTSSTDGSEKRGATGSAVAAAAKTAKTTNSNNNDDDDNANMDTTSPSAYKDSFAEDDQVKGDLEQMDTEDSDVDLDSTTNQSSAFKLQQKEAVTPLPYSVFDKVRLVSYHISNAIGASKASITFQFLTKQGRPLTVNLLREHEIKLFFLNSVPEQQFFDRLDQIVKSVELIEHICVTDSEIITTENFGLRYKTFCWTTINDFMKERSN